MYNLCALRTSWHWHEIVVFIIYFLKSFLFSATVNIPFLMLRVYFLGGRRNYKFSFKLLTYNWMHKEFSFHCCFRSSHSISGFHVFHLFIALHIICNDSGRR